VLCVMEWKLRKVKETSPTARENAVEPLLLVYDEPRPLAAPRSAAFRAPMFCRLRMGKLRVHAMEWHVCRSLSWV